MLSIISSRAYELLLLCLRLYRARVLKSNTIYQVESDNTQYEVLRGTFHCFMVSLPATIFYSQTTYVYMFARRNEKWNRRVAKWYSITPKWPSVICQICVHCNKLFSDIRITICLTTMYLLKYRWVIYHCIRYLMYNVTRVFV